MLVWISQCTRLPIDSDERLVWERIITVIEMARSKHVVTRMLYNHHEPCHDTLRLQ